MSWQDEVDGIEERSKLAKKMGGDEAVARQHARGRMTIRERIDALADAGSFREEGPLAGFGELDDEGRLKEFTPGNYVLGVAQLDGNPVVVGGEDFTQRGGSRLPRACVRACTPRSSRSVTGFPSCVFLRAVAAA